MLYNKVNNSLTFADPDDPFNDKAAAPKAVAFAAETAEDPFGAPVAKANDAFANFADFGAFQ